MRFLKAWLALTFLATLAGGFTWGFAAHRQRSFPYGLLRWLAREAAQATGGVPLLQGEEHRVRDSRSPVFERLSALGYVEGTADPEAARRGVVRVDPARASPGYGLYATFRDRGAFLIDLDGRVIHRWEAGESSWDHVHALEDGSVLVLSQDRELKRVDRASRVVWRVRGRFHHDFGVSGRGDIWALVREERQTDRFAGVVTLLDDLVQLDSRDGRELRRIGLLEALESSAFAFLLPALDRTETATSGVVDILHANHVELLEGAAAGYGGADALVSLRALNLIVGLDLASGELRWGWGPGNLHRPHHPTLLPGGNLLIFDNGEHRSRVIELEPVSRRVVWQYGPVDGFFSETRGSAQRLPNGNTLITESDAGYVFEVTREGEVVWEFANPDVSERGVRRAIWRMTRFEPAHPFGIAVGVGERGRPVESPAP